MEIIERYPNKFSDYDYISLNPNITMEFIEKNKDKINFRRLSYNRFNYEKNKRTNNTNRDI